MEPPGSKWKELGPRVASAIVLALGFIGALWIGGWLFILLVILAALLMAREWNGLTEKDEPALRLIGMFYVAAPCASLIWLRGLATTDAPDAGFFLALFVILVVSATDIGAYFTGRAIGRTKLAPAISPGKTWEGLGGGMALAGICGALASNWTPFGTLGCFALSLALAAVSQAGDLLESWMKRRAGVKDSGTLIPGHGGLLDRVDGLAFALPVFALLIALSRHGA